MPNHVTTQMTLSPKVARAITRPPSEEEIAKNDEGNAWFIERFEKRKAEGGTSPGEEPYQSTLPDLVVDFELIVPSPPNKETGGCSGTHEPGEVCWYSWNIDNWGTKWNAYSPVVEPRAGDLAFVQFDTAWSHPFPVIRALSEQFPDEVIKVRYADEDLGFNLGAYQIKNGEVLDILNIEWGTDEACDLASLIKYGQSYEDLRREYACDSFTEDEDEKEICGKCGEHQKYHESAKSEEAAR